MSGCVSRGTRRPLITVCTVCTAGPQHRPYYLARCYFHITPPLKKAEGLSGTAMPKYNVAIGPSVPGKTDNICYNGWNVEKVTSRSGKRGKTLNLYERYIVKSEG